MLGEFSRFSLVGRDAGHGVLPQHPRHTNSASVFVGQPEECSTNHLCQSGEALFEKASAKHEAQELALRATRTKDADESFRLSSRALELDPTCVDALVHIARLSCGTHGDLVEGLRIAVSAGERGLGGPAYFRENRGRFGTTAETRPYMRARTYLACLLVEAGKVDEAIRHYEELLLLDADDHQGVGYHLLACYFTRNDFDGVRLLLSRFQGVDSTVFAWAAVLERWVSGNLEAAAHALSDARQANRRVETYLTKTRPIPKSLPEQPCLDDEEREAIFCARHPRAGLAQTAQSGGLAEANHIISDPSMTHQIA
jgi:tetratricopeptide (TPR) repeat protein